MVNLLPEEIKEIEKRRVFMKWIRTGTVAVVSLLVILSLNVYSKLNQASIALVNEKNVIEQKKKQYANISSMAAAGTQYNEFMTIQNEIKKKDATFITLMKYLSASLPENIHLKDLEFDRYNRIMAGIPKNSVREALQKDEKAIRESMKIPSTASDSQKDAAAALAAKKTTETLERDYGVKIIGYIYGDADMVETALMGIMVRLQKTGFLKNVDIAQKEIKDMKGQNALEFTLTARCMVYEI